MGINIWGKMNRILDYKINLICKYVNNVSKCMFKLFNLFLKKLNLL